MEKILFWESPEKNWQDGRYYGDVITDPENVIDAVCTAGFNFLVWSEIPGSKATELELPVDLKDKDIDELAEALAEIVGAPGEMASGREDIFEVTNCLAFDLDEKCFFNLTDVETFKAYGYAKNGNWTYVVLDEIKAEYEFEVIDSYNLDYQEKGPNSTDFTYGGLGEHAKIHKVREGKNTYLLMHQWSQWQGSELDSGYLLTANVALEAMEALENHPEYEEIREWLEAE